jgi:hypothetical protein
MYSTAREKAYRPARKELTTFAVLTIILIITTIINACICTHNFNKGLKPYITSKQVEDEEEPFKYGATTEMSNGPAAGRANTSRIEID